MTDISMVGPDGGEQMHTFTPTLVIWGEADRIVDPGYGRAYAAAIPGARFELLPGTGHLPQLETPEQLVRAVRDFISAALSHRE
jgi:pimeloyl-ACP methyl ester carboxylesterase